VPEADLDRVLAPVTSEEGEDLLLEKGRIHPELQREPAAEAVAQLHEQLTRKRATPRLPS
jgi:hypothetical protein